MSVEPAVFRDVLAQWPSGVTVVTTLVDGVRHGMTASSFSSVSLDPPLVSICVDRQLYTHGLLESSGVFAVNVLAKDQAELARRFAGMESGVVDRFEGQTWSTAVTGVPLLDSGLGWLDCRIVHRYPGGDHTIFVGEVLAGHAARKTAPLLFHSRGWGQYADVLPDIATLSDGGLLRSLLRHGIGKRDAEAATLQVAEAGVRVRMLDLTTGDRPTPMPAAAGGTSALVRTAAQARQAVDHGVDVVEVLADPTDQAQLAEVEAVRDILDGPGVTALLTDAFAPHRWDDVLTAVERLSHSGLVEVCLDDADGSSTPLHVRALLQEAVGLARPVPLRARFHDRHRLGLVKALTALKSGVNHFDTTLGGLDGVLATEDLVRLLGTLDVTVPADVAALARVAATLDARRPEHPLSTAPTNGTPLVPGPSRPVGVSG